MHRHTPRLFSHLRRHRGVWVLALAVLLFKVAMSTFCVLDGPRVAFSSAATNTAVAAVTAPDGDDDLCVLDEGKGCHCTCAHAVAMPTATTAMLAVTALSTVEQTLPAVAAPVFARSPLRPPIA